jgi:hypothetical protein
VPDGSVGARSPWCQAARNAARPYDPPSGALLALLDLPIHKRETRRQAQRAASLRALFDALEPAPARELWKHLSTPTDPFARFFDCELSTALRVELRRRLDVARSRPVHPAPGPTAMPPPRTQPPARPPGPIPISVPDPPPFEPEPPDADVEQLERIIKTVCVFPPPREGWDLRDLLRQTRTVIRVARHARRALQAVAKLERLVERIEREWRELDPLVRQLFLLALPGRALTGLRMVLRFRQNRLVVQVLALGVHREFRLSDMLSMLRGADAATGLRVLSLESAIANLEHALERPASLRDPHGRFRRREPGQAPPGSTWEREVCRRVARRYRHSATQVHVKRYAPRGSFPGQPPPPGFVLSDPRAKVDCVGSHRLGGELRLYEAKESGPGDLTNPGLTGNQRITYADLQRRGGEVVATRGPFRIGTVIPAGTVVTIVTPQNISVVLPEP